jgi:hypothetical protein
MAGNVYVGSAFEDAPANRGWLLGHFMPDGDLRHSTEVEIKWGVHSQGDQRAEWVRGEIRTTLIVCVQGRFRIDFPHRSVVLAGQGSYVVFDGIEHSWQAEEDSVILGVRWPSVPGYAVEAGSGRSAGDS